MTRPTKPATLGRCEKIQGAAPVAFEGVHDEFRCNLATGVYHGMHVVGTYLRREQPPVLGTTDPANRSKNHAALIGVRLKWRLPERGFRMLAQLGPWIRWPNARHIVIAVNCAWLARKVASVAGKSDEVRRRAK